MLSLPFSCSSNRRLLVALVVFGGLASGCQSSRPGFAFQPIVLRAAGPTPVANTAAETGVRAAAAPTAAPVPAARLVASSPAAASRAPVERAAPAARLEPVLSPLPALATAQTTATTAAVRNQADAPVRRHLLRRKHAPAEVGLGLTVLGLLGMVVLVVALVGLAISGGGLGWVITAGIAAGVVLLAYLDPGGH